MKKWCIILVAILLFAVVGCTGDPAVPSDAPVGTGAPTQGQSAAPGQSDAPAQTPGQVVVTPAPTNAAITDKGDATIPEKVDNALLYHYTDHGDVNQISPAVELYAQDNSSEMNIVLNALRSGKKTDKQPSGNPELLVSFFSGGKRYFYQLFRQGNEIIFNAYPTSNAWVINETQTGALNAVMNKYNMIPDSGKKALGDYSTYSGIVSGGGSGYELKKVTDTSEFAKILARQGASLSSIDLNKLDVLCMSLNADSFSYKYSIGRLEVEGNCLTAYVNAYAPTGGMIDSSAAQSIYIVVPKADLNGINDFAYVISNFPK